MYRPNVCVVIINKKGNKLLMFRRIGIEDYGWQFPQGGIDQNETDKEALFRELAEEIGTNDIKILNVSKKRIKYKFPQWVRDKMAAKVPKRTNFKGQKQRWYLVRLKNGTDSIHFDHEPAEFDQFEWVSPAKAIERIIPFKRKACKEGLKSLKVL